MATTSMDRVAVNTPDSFNERIEQCTRERVARCAAAGPAAIERRLEELDHEWDVERTLETVAPSFTLTGILLGLTVNRKWFALPLVVNAFFLQHAIQGWCPPLPVLRGLGFRTAVEINRERMALKMLRGDFGKASRSKNGTQRDVDRAMAAVRE